ncbi:DNA polymerase III subunit beta [compost metagenome]
MTVAKKSLVNAAKLARDDDKVTIQAEAARLIVKHNDITYYIPVYSGNYPQVPMPKKDFMTSFTLEKSEFLGVLERGASILEDGGSIKGILQVEKGKVIVEGQTQRNDFHESITTEVEGKKAKVTIDLKRMTEILKNVDAEKIQIGIDTGKPVTIRPDGRTDHTCLLAVG